MRVIGSLISAFRKRAPALMVVGIALVGVAPDSGAVSASEGVTPPTTAGAEPGTIVLRSRVFDIPFQMDRDSRASVVTLFVSSDHGKTWKPASEQPVPIEKFHFEATADGDYWFTHATDLDSITDPAGQLTPERKIRIDTQGPKIDLAGNADLSGKLAARVELDDPHQVASLRILYATDVVREWKRIENAAVDSEGGFSIRPEEDWRQMSVHITATDSIGNVSVESKMFRRPRMAATSTRKFASDTAESGAQIASRQVPASPASDESRKNQLRIRTAAGPADPPSFLIGPGPSSTQSPNPGNTNPGVSGQEPTRQGAATQGTITHGNAGNPGNRSALQSPGSGPLRLPHSAALRTTTRPPTNAAVANPSATSPPAAIPTSPQPNAGRALGSFGSAFRGVAAPNAAPVAKPEPKSQPMTLPASGVTAKVTPDGIEVLPPPTGEPEASTDAPGAMPEQVPAPQPTPSPADSAQADSAQADSSPSNAANLPSFNAPALQAPALQAPATAGGATRSPDDPITEAVPTPQPEKAPASDPQRARSLQEALRPLSSEANGIRTNPYTQPEEIPAPTPSRTPDDERRYRADRAEQAVREQQSQFDRAQLGRNVPFRFCDSNRFSLEYELEAVGASGVEAVELYGSLDGGKTWKRWGADPDRTSPFDIETKGEGVFSFRIVVLGNNGLASPRPLPGDEPDIAVIVDQTLPQIKITSARYGEGDRTGSLVIRYECSDEHLATRPVTLAFSRSLDGPWTTIAAGLRNDGLYVWPADPKLPPAIYLRVDATDQAGNAGSYVLDQPIATGGLAPRARILGFQSR